MDIEVGRVLRSGIAALAVLLSGLQVLSAQTINVLYTTDVHGSVLNYNFQRDTAATYSLSKVYTYVESVRDTSENVVLLDGGDFLQGTPMAYYYNFVDTTSMHAVARAMNFMRYDAVTVGNHDIEAQHKVYDKVVKEIEAPVLGGNVTDTKTGRPYFTPYTIVKRAGKKIAVIGLTSPYIAHWLPKHYWEGMDFEDMIESARKWVGIVKEVENPDAIIGLFHAGYDYTYGGLTADTYKNENASVLVAEKVEGFDAILIGHDHKLKQKTVKSPSGKEVLILDAGAGARFIGLLSMTFDKKGGLTMKTDIRAMKSVPESETFNKRFASQVLATKEYTRRSLGRLKKSVSSIESLAGSSAFVDVIHKVMLKASGADITMTAPLQLGTVIPEGPINVGTLFGLYRFENTLCIFEMTGKEVKDYLEYSYDMWVTDPRETGTVLALQKKGKLKYNEYSLDSAAGIKYTVDVTKPKGQRVEITGMTNGKKFDMKKKYRVALNSYRACGGGGHLELGVGIKYEDIQGRIVKTIDKDIRDLLIAEFEEMAKKDGKIELKPMDNWKFVPERLVKKYMTEDLKAFQGR